MGRKKPKEMIVFSPQGGKNDYQPIGREDWKWSTQKILRENLPHFCGETPLARTISQI